jgi:hypothetical protein
MMPPQRIVMEARKMRGPIFRMMTVAGGWQMTYGMKKMRVMTLYLSIPVFLNPRSTLILRRKISIGAHRKSAADWDSDSPSNVGGAQIGSVHQTDAVHGAEGENEAAINAVHDAPLLLVGEAADARVLVVGRGGDDILLVDARLLHVGASLAIVAISDVWGGDLSAGSVLFAGEKPHGWQVAVSTLSGV